MKPATEPRGDPAGRRLLRIDPAGAFSDHTVRDLPALLRPGDLVVVNDAATIPASLQARTAHGAPLEVRLASWADARSFWAILFGAGDWRTRTEERPAPPLLAAGETLWFGPEFSARVEALDPRSPRLVRLSFAGDPARLWWKIFQRGRPVQYAYLSRALHLWDIQTHYAGRPWAVEPPSTGFFVTPALRRALQGRGIAVAWLTHAAGLSSTGEEQLDRALPLPERFLLPRETAEAVAAARQRGGRVIAAGTTVVRALESAASTGRVIPGEGTATLRLSASTTRRVVDGLLSGTHEPGTSHFALQESFAPTEVLQAAYAHAARVGYLAHEFGDATLLL